MKPGITYDILDIMELQKGIDYKEIIIPPDPPEPPKLIEDALAYYDGYTCFFYNAFKCFARRQCIHYYNYHVIFNRYVYSVDGRRFIGLYDPKFPNDINDGSFDYCADDINPDYRYCIPCLLCKLWFYTKF